MFYFSLCRIFTFARLNSIIMVKSKPHWVLIVLFSYLIVFGISFMIVCLKLNAENPVPLGAWSIPIAICSSGLCFLILWIKYAKRLSISNNSIQIDFIFRKKTFEYSFKDIIGFDKHENLGRFKDYESFHFKTSDDKTYMFVDYEFRNYKLLKEAIEANCIQVKISRYHQLKDVLITFLCSLTITIFVVLVTLILSS